MRINVVYGTRPEFIKLAPLILKLKQFSNVRLQVISTGQHKEMLVGLEQLFEIVPDISLEIMTDNQTVNSVVAKVMLETEKIIEKNRPDLVLVQGDTATVLATAMACYYSNVKVGHIEAGLRSFDMQHPFPEEFNRRVVSLFADFNFAPTAISAENLIKENVDKSKVFITGNTVIDALLYLKSRIKITKANKKLILVTAHRRENHGNGILQICKAIKQLLSSRDDISFLWPLHPNPNVKNVVLDEIGNLDGIQFVEPLDYVELLSSMNNSYLIWTDSGGIQEEAPTFKKPVLILREVTERPEVISSGFGKLVGTNKDVIIAETLKLLNDTEYYTKTTSGSNPFGDGNAVDLILEHLKIV